MFRSKRTWSKPSLFDSWGPLLKNIIQVYICQRNMSCQCTYFTVTDLIGPKCLTELRRWRTKCPAWSIWIRRRWFLGEENKDSGLISTSSGRQITVRSAPLWSRCLPEPQTSLVESRRQATCINPSISLLTTLEKNDILCWQDEIGYNIQQWKLEYTWSWLHDEFRSIRVPKSKE